MNKVKPWTSEEIQFLKDNYLELGGRQIAEKLGRTQQSVYKKAIRMDISKEKLIPIGYHYCAKCKKLRPISAFYINRLNRYCKECNRAYYTAKKKAVIK